MVVRIAYLNIAIMILGFTSALNAETGSIAGVAVYENGSALHDAYIQLLGTSDDSDTDCRTDINGWFCFTGIETGCYDLVAHFPCFYPDTLFSNEIVPDDTLLVYPILIWRPYPVDPFHHMEPMMYMDNGVVTGTISSIEGDPIDRVVVLPFDAENCSVGRQGYSGSDGNYVLLLPSGVYSFDYRVAGYYPETIDSITVVTDDTTRVDLILSRPLHE